MKPHTPRKLHETGVIRKRWENRISIALVFPDSYSLGMSNLGFQRVYELFNQFDQIVAERFFLPESLVYGKDIRSLESSRALWEFDLIVFSISFEYSYLNVPLVLAAGRIGVFSDSRASDAPIVLAGGIACQINPAPLSSIVDGFLLGDFEAICPSLVEFLEAGAIFSGRKKVDILESLASSCQGVYVPVLHQNVCNSSAEKHVRNKERYRVIPAIEENPPAVLPHSVVMSEDAAFSDTFLLEVSKGCGRGCRFCAAGYVYRPPRPWPIESIFNTLALAGNSSKIGLVGLEFLDKKGFCDLTAAMLEKKYQLGFSSLRADAVTEDFAAVLAASGSKTATIAAEAGSERLRKVLNKNLTEEQLLTACDILLSAGIRNLKVYFMLGLPFEEDNDAEEIVRLSRRILTMLVSAGKGRGTLGHLTVSISTFVPKAWTPFQWAGFVQQDIIERRRQVIRKGLAGVPNVRLRFDSWRKAFIQAVLSRGGRELGQTLVLSRLKGKGSKQTARAMLPLAGQYIRARNKDECFPWEIIHHRVKREFLYSQWQKAARGVETSFCDLGKCRKCGACVSKK